MKRHKYGAKKTICAAGHSHPSRKEAKRCDELHLLQRAGEIEDLVIEPSFKFYVDGRPVKLGNGSVAGYRPDFSYTENGVDVVEDCKGMIVRDFPLRAALFRACFPTIQLRIT
jgi:metallophosphoesterase superfamily enzyme